MKSFEIVSVSTHAEPTEAGPLHAWADVTVRIERGFDWEKGASGLVKKIRAATQLNEEAEGDAR